MEIFKERDHCMPDMISLTRIGFMSHEFRVRDSTGHRFHCSQHHLDTFHPVIRHINCAVVSLCYSFIQKNLISSQIKVHQPFGGVVPALAKREHQKNLPNLIKEIGEWKK